MILSIFSRIIENDNVQQLKCDTVKSTAISEICQSGRMMVVSAKRTQTQHPDVKISLLIPDDLKPRAYHNIHTNPLRLTAAKQQPKIIMKSRRK